MEGGELGKDMGGVGDLALLHGFDLSIELTQHDKLLIFFFLVYARVNKEKSMMNLSFMYSISITRVGKKSMRSSHDISNQPGLLDCCKIILIGQVFYIQRHTKSSIHLL